MTKTNNNIINSFIKNQLLNEFIQHKKFLDSQDSNEQQLLHLIEDNGELWVSIHIEHFFKKLLQKNQKTITSFTPFFLIPIKINNSIKLKNEETMNDFFIKLKAININTTLYKDVFYIKNVVEHEQIPSEQPLLKIDDKRKIKYLFSREDKKEFLKELKIMKSLDVFDIFEIKKLINFIENRLKEYLNDQNNFFFFSSIIEEVMVDLKTKTIKREFSETKPINFSIKEESIILNVNED